MTRREFMIGRIRKFVGYCYTDSRYGCDEWRMKLREGLSGLMILSSLSHFKMILEQMGIFDLIVMIMSLRFGLLLQC